MEFKMNMNCTKEAFYSFLCNSLKEEFKVKEIHAGITIKKDMLSKMGKKISCELKLVNLRKNIGYKIEINSLYGKNTLEYEMLDSNGKCFTLKYIEKYITDSKMKKYNNMLLEFLFGYFLIKNKRKKLKQIDEYLVEKEKNG